MEPNRLRPVDCYPAYHRGDRVFDPEVLGRVGVVVNMTLIEGTEDWEYTVKWLSDRSLTKHIAEQIRSADPFIQQMVHSINGLMDEMRSLYSYGAPKTNSNLGEFMKWASNIEPGFKTFLELYQEMKVLVDLRNNFLSL